MERRRLLKGVCEISRRADVYLGRIGHWDSVSRILQSLFLIVEALELLSLAYGITG